MRQFLPNCLYMRIRPKTIILALKRNQGYVWETALELNIHRSTVYRWRKRANTGWGFSSAKLRRKSTRPHHIRGHSLSSKELSKAVELRNSTGWTAEKIVFELKLPVSSLTLHREFKKLRIVRKYGYHRRPLFQNTIHIHLGNTKTIGFLQMDVKDITPELCGLPYTCFEYGVIDIFSRYKEAVILNHLDQDGSMSAIIEILPKLPFKPVFLQTDNGLEFQGRFQSLLSDLKINYHAIHKSTPNENALIERSFRTDEEEFFFRLKRAPYHYDELRIWFAEFLNKYNTWRPHLGINLKTPMKVIQEELLVANVC